jgi:DNA-binding LacI/PurR family transcriptional regulator
LDVPVVSVGCRLPGVPGVLIADETAAATATRHLIGLGHRRVAMLSGTHDDPVGAVTTRHRQAGFRAALAQAGIEDVCIIQEAWGIAGGERAMERLLGEAVLPTAVFAESDEMAFGALRKLRHAGIPVPGRMSVVGLDDHEFAAAVDLTTVAQPVTAQGRAAATALLEMLTSDRRPRSTVLPTRLVVRGSTAPPGE